MSVLGRLHRRLGCPLQDANRGYRCQYCGGMKLDHLYRETSHWERSVEFWSQLGFDFAESWGEEPHRAGRLTNGAASVVLAETSRGGPGESTFLAVRDIDAVASAVGESVIDTHWGTRMVSVTDPDGRTYNFEPRSDAE